MGYNGIAVEGELTNFVKFQSVPACTKREMSRDQGDSGKKVLPGVERFRYRLFSGFPDYRKEVDQFFYLCPRPFRRSTFPAIQSLTLRENRDKRGMCRGVG